MSSILLKDITAVASTGLVSDVSILVEAGKIAEISSKAERPTANEIVEAERLTAFPGFIDVHIHGAVGVDVNSADTDGLVEIAKFLAANGVTSWMPTLVPDSDENYRKVIASIDRLMEIQAGRPIAQAVGVHYEGVFANEKMCGALRPEFFRTYTGDHPVTTPSADRPGRSGHPSSDQEGSQGRKNHPVAPTTPSADHPAAETAAPLLKPGGELNPATPPQAGGELWSTLTTPSAEAAATPPKTGGELIGLPRLKRGVHMMTLAPEIDGGIELIRDLRRQGWVASIGHTSSGVEVLDQAFDAGARHLTHFYNAMTGLHHRDVGVVGWALTKKDVTFDIIADGIHVHPKMLEFACTAKSADNVLLISDSVAPTGLGDGEYEIWGEKVSVVNGRTQNERGSIAGSMITMLDAVKRMLSLGFSAVEVAKMAALNPARLLGIDTNYGSIEVGKRADIVALDKDGNVKLVMVGGEVVFDQLTDD